MINGKRRRVTTDEKNITANFTCGIVEWMFNVGY